jgi:hypothetical protein
LTLAQEDIYALAQTKLALDKEVTMHVASADAVMADSPAADDAAAAAPADATAEDGKPSVKKVRKTAATKAAEAAKAGVAEGDEAASAKQMSRSLLSRMREKFADKPATEAGEGGPSSAAPTSDAPMDAGEAITAEVAEEAKAEVEHAKAEADEPSTTEMIDDRRPAGGEEGVKDEGDVEMAQT